MMRVELTYFKAGGKYYSEGTFEVPDDASMSAKIAMNTLPGLIKGCSEFIVLINVPEHESDHPRLMNIAPSLLQEWNKI
jgi:hypothetical protein